MIQKNAIIEHASFIVDDKDGLMAQTGERAYPIDGLYSNDEDVLKHIHHLSGMNDELFSAVKIIPYQKATAGFVVYYINHN